MKFFLTGLGLLFGFTAVTTASSGRQVFDHASKLREAIVEKREFSGPVESSRLEKRNSPYLNDKSKRKDRTISSFASLS